MPALLILTGEIDAKERKDQTEGNFHPEKIIVPI